jgi:hypothetical protein
VSPFLFCPVIVKVRRILKSLANRVTYCRLCVVYGSWL